MRLYLNLSILHPFARADRVDGLYRFIPLTFPFYLPFITFAFP